MAISINILKFAQTVLRKTPVAFHALLLFHHAAKDDSNWKEEDTKRDGCRWVIVLDGSPAVSAVFPRQVIIFCPMFLAAPVTPSIHDICGLAFLVFLRAVAFRFSFHAKETLSTSLSNTEDRFQRSHFLMLKLRPDSDCSALSQ